jgi:uncharacterized protein YuzE
MVQCQRGYLNIQIGKKTCWESVKVAPNVIIDLARNSYIIGVEILNAKEAFKHMMFL